MGNSEESDNAHIDGFRVGAGIYLGTFFLGNNWDYRLMFLIFAIPQLVSWSNENGKRLVSFFTLVAIIFSCWSIAFWTLGRGLDLPDELVNWLLFAMLLYLLLVSLPTWIRTPIQRRSGPGRKTPLKAS